MEEKEKTIKQWLSTLKWTIRMKAEFNRERFLKNASFRLSPEEFNKMETQTFPDITTALFGAFDFKNTPEGSDYWNRIIAKDFKQK